MNDRRMNAAKTFAPVMLTVLILFIVYAVKGVYPFGDNDIAYYDMNVQYVPHYARCYEILHGADSLTFDWLSGAGMDMTGSYPGYVLHPINWILFFVRPENVLKFMGAFLAIKLILCSLSISLYTKSKYDLGILMHTALCLVYVFSGYVLQQYVNIFFLDSMMIFPLIMLAFGYMSKSGSGAPYLLLMTLQVATSYYLGVMTLIFLLFYSFGEMRISVPEGERKGYAARVGVYTGLSVIIALITVFPGLIKTTGSARFTERTPSLTYILEAANPDNQFFYQKLFVAFNTELAIAFLLIIIFNKLVRRRGVTSDLRLRIFAFVLMLMPILNEAVLLIWHMGSYVHFPYRNGYIYVFTATEIIAYCWQEKRDEPLIMLTDRKWSYICAAAVIVLSVVSLVLSILMFTTFFSNGIYQGFASYDNFGISFILILIAAVMSLVFFKKKVTGSAFFSLSLVRIIVAAVCFIAPVKKYQYIISSDAVEGAAQIRPVLRQYNDSLSRVKSLYPLFSLNYSQIVGVPSINQWLTDMSPAFHEEIVYLGYAATHDHDPNYDWGGTIFSDALLGDKWAVTYNEIEADDALYTEISRTDEYVIYDMDYTLPFGILADEDILSLDVPNQAMIDNYMRLGKDEREYTSVFAHQMMVSDAFADGGKEIIREIKPEQAQEIEPVNEDYKHTMRFDVHTDVPSVLYGYIYKYTHLTVNGVKYDFPCFKNNDEYSVNDVGLGFLMLGVFDKDEDICIEVSNQSGEFFNDQFALLDLDAMRELCDKYEHSCASSYKAGKNSLDITADVDGKNFMFLPLEYLPGWKAEANGQPVKIHPVMNNAFMALELPDGHCDIHMTYMNPYLPYGAALSLIGIAAAIAVEAARKKGHDICEVKWIGSTAYVLLNVIAVGGLVVVYVLPLVV